jgi:hypothetical protein
VNAVKEREREKAQSLLLSQASQLKNNVVSLAIFDALKRTARKPMDRERNRVVRQQRKGDMKKRAVGYEDPAKPVWVSAPFIAVAATTAFLIAGHLLSRRPGVPVEMEETEVKEEREPIIVLLFQVVTTTTIIR